MVRATGPTVSPKSGGDAHAPITRNLTVVRARARRLDVRAPGGVCARGWPRRSRRAAQIDAGQARRGDALGAVRDALARVVRSRRVPGPHRVLGAVRDP